MTKLKNFINPNSERDEFDITDFDNTDGWHWKDVDHLIDMGFEMSGDTRLKLSDKQENFCYDGITQDTNQNKHYCNLTDANKKTAQCDYCNNKE